MYVVALDGFHNHGKYSKYETCAKLDESYLMAKSIKKLMKMGKSASSVHLYSDAGERSGVVVECLTQDRGAVGSSLTGVTALWSLSKTHLS